MPFSHLPEPPSGKGDTGQQGFRARLGLNGGFDQCSQMGSRVEGKEED